VDISHPNFEEQFEVVTKTLLEINKEEKPTIVVFNKIDAFTYLPKAPDDLSPIVRDNVSLEELEKTWMSKIHNDCLFISAKEKLHIDALKEMLYKRIREIHITRFPYNDFLFPTDLDEKEDNEENIIENNITPVE
jgi:GTP-binding protein HflX